MIDQKIKATTTTTKIKAELSKDFVIIGYKLAS
jgi:hypothetical protein